MKAKVIEAFRDKNTKKKYKPNDEYQADKERIEELVKLGYLKKLPTRRKTKKKEDE